MRPVVQSRTGNRGTCLRACLASILNLKEAQVPDFPQANQDPGVNRFLAKYGLRYEQRPISEPAPAGWGTVEGTSPRGGEHACVRYGSKLVWDPHPQDGTGRGLTKKKTWGCLVPVSEEVRPVGVAYGTENPEASDVYIAAPDGAPGNHVMNGRRSSIRQSRDVTLSKKAFAYPKWLVTVECTSNKAGIKKGLKRQFVQYAANPERAIELTVKNQVYPEFWRGVSVRAMDGGKAKDGALSNTALLLAALWAWYRSRMDAPALEPRNYDLNTYVPRQRAFDGSKFEWKCPKCGQVFTGESSDPLEDRAWHHLETVHNDESTLVKIHRNTE